jgi:hypothetical protein
LRTPSAMKAASIGFRRHVGWLHATSPSLLVSQHRPALRKRQAAKRPMSDELPGTERSAEKREHPQNGGGKHRAECRRDRPVVFPYCPNGSQKPNEGNRRQ